MQCLHRDLLSSLNLGHETMLNLESLAFDYEPFPIGIARPAVDADVYREMVKTFPTPE